MRPASTAKTVLEDWIGAYTPERVIEKFDKVWPDLLAGPVLEKNLALFRKTLLG